MARKRTEYRACDQCASNIELHNLRERDGKLLCAWCAPTLWAKQGKE